MNPKLWSELGPDPRMVAALDEADAKGTRAIAVASTQRPPKHKWSNNFADACARMVAEELARNPEFKKLDVLPRPGGSAEPVMFPVGGERKKIDVAASERAQGLQLGISLKGMNFRDRAGWQFDKNLTGRTYELENEIRGVHRGLPRAYMVALYFLPLASVNDKKSEDSPSSFARTVQHLRSRMGRTDPHAAMEMDRVDMAAIALYVPGDVEEFEYTTGSGNNRTVLEFRYEDSLPRGIVRYFDVRDDPPRRGRPQLGTTLDLSGLITRISEGFVRFTKGAPINWASPESH